MSGFYEPSPTSTSPFRDRLFHPQWAIIERALGRPVPGILRELYGTPEALLRGHFYLDQPGGGARRVWLDLFLPLDEEALHPYGKLLPAGAVAFADDEQATIRIVVLMVGREGFDQRRVALVRRDAPYHQDIGLAVSIRIQDPLVGLNRINTINAMKRWNDVAL